MATFSPQVFPAQKMKVIRPRLMAHRSSIPPNSQSSLRTSGPRTMAAKADPTSRKPTTLFTPEHAETTLRGKVLPVVGDDEERAVERGDRLGHRDEAGGSSRSPHRVAAVNASRTLSSTDW